MKNLFGLMAIAALAIACDDDDNNNATIVDARVGVEMRATTMQSQIDASGRTQET
jgi:hypothetical protein